MPLELRRRKRTARIRVTKLHRCNPVRSRHDNSRDDEANGGYCQQSTESPARMSPHFFSPLSRWETYASLHSSVKVAAHRTLLRVFDGGDEDLAYVIGTITPVEATPQNKAGCP